jgi:hypothetical protein
MCKKYFLVPLLFCSLNLFAQDEESVGFFKKENLFTGGTVNGGFGNTFTNLGIGPYIGYSFNKYIDFAVNPSVNYTSQRDVGGIPGARLRQTLYGPGAFVRLFPAKFLFAHAQYEYNLIRYHYLPAIGSPYLEEKIKFDAHSFLIGGGISNGKDFPNQKSYYYFSVLWDVAKSPNSPYKDRQYNLNRAVPIIRAGYNIALFQGRK